MRASFEITEKIVYYLEVITKNCVEVRCDHGSLVALYFTSTGLEFKEPWTNVFDLNEAFRLGNSCAQLLWDYRNLSGQDKAISD